MRRLSLTSDAAAFSDALAGAADQANTQGMSTTSANSQPFAMGFGDRIQQYFNQADLERLFGEGMVPPTLESLDLGGEEITPPSREEVVQEDFPAFTEEAEIPTEEAQQHANEQVVIPENSNSILIGEETSRFSSAIWYDKVREQKILLAGAGGIGSYVGFLLSRMHPAKITVFDPDAVEDANLSGQFYSENDIGRNKASCLNSMMGRFSRYYDCFTRAEFYAADSPNEDIMICGFDNMASRQVFYRRWKEKVMSYRPQDRSKCLFIDGRLAAEEFQVFCIQGNNTLHMEKFERDWLFSDEEAEATQCSYKQTSFCANMIASVMVNLFVNFIANKCEPLIDRAVPFFTYYDASQMFLREDF